MAQMYKVVGGLSNGGILVRTGVGLKSPEASPSRVSAGAIIQELELQGQRLKFRLMQGTGPEEGWVSLTLKDTPLVEKTTTNIDTAVLVRKDSQIKTHQSDPLPPDVELGVKDSQIKTHQSDPLPPDVEPVSLTFVRMNGESIPGANGTFASVAEARRLVADAVGEPPYLVKLVSAIGNLLKDGEPLPSKDEVVTVAVFDRDGFLATLAVSEKIEFQIKEIIHVYFNLDLEEIKTDVDLFYQGLTSGDTLALRDELASLFPNCRISPTLLWDYRSIDAIVAYLEEKIEYASGEK